MNAFQEAHREAARRQNNVQRQRRSRPRSLVGRLNLQQYVVYFGFLAIFLFFAVMLGDSGFLTVRNLSNIVLQTAPVTIMAIGLVFVMSAGEIDLSIGSIVAVAALAAAVAMSRYGMAAGVLAGLGCRVRHRPAQRRCSSPMSSCRRSWSRWPPLACLPASPAR